MTDRIRSLKEKILSHISSLRLKNIFECLNQIFHDFCTDATIGKDKLKKLYADETKLDFSEVPEPDILYQISKAISLGAYIF